MFRIDSRPTLSMGEIPNRGGIPHEVVQRAVSARRALAWELAGEKGVLPRSTGPGSCWARPCRTRPVAGVCQRAWPRDPSARSRLLGSLRSGTSRILLKARSCSRGVKSLNAKAPSFVSKDLNFEVLRMDLIYTSTGNVENLNAEQRCTCNIWVTDGRVSKKYNLYCSLVLAWVFMSQLKRIWL